MTIRHVLSAFTELFLNYIKIHHSQDMP